MLDNEQQFPLQMDLPHWYGRENPPPAINCERREQFARMKGQAEGLAVGVLFAGFFALLIRWSF